jgi:putative transcriptional regulator
MSYIFYNWNIFFTFKYMLNGDYMKTNIRFLRHEIGISQQDLAEKVDVTRQTINALENGKYNPSLLLAYKITKILNCEYIEDVFIIKNNGD